MFLTQEIGDSWRSVSKKSFWSISDKINRKLKKKLLISYSIRDQSTKKKFI